MYDIELIDGQPQATRDIGKDESVSVSPEAWARISSSLATKGIAVYVEPTGIPPGGQDSGGSE